MGLPVRRACEEGWGVDVHTPATGQDVGRALPREPGDGASGPFCSVTSGKSLALSGPYSSPGTMKGGPDKLHWFPDDISRAEGPRAGPEGLSWRHCAEREQEG